MKHSSHDADQSVKAAQTLRKETGEEKGEKILRARPVAGEVDHEALSREIIARFPKILAKLAE